MNVNYGLVNWCCKDVNCMVAARAAGPFVVHYAVVVYLL